MSDPINPTPQHTQLLLQDTTTKTSGYNTPALDLGAGYAPGGLGQSVAAVINATALDLADGNETYSAALQDSADNIAWNSVGASVTITSTGVTAAKGRLKNRYVRLSLTLGGTTPSITFKA